MRVMAKLVTAGRWFLQVVNSVQEMGLDCEDLCHSSGFDYSFLKENDGRIDADQAFDFWDNLAEKTNNPEIGLTLASKIKLGGFKALGFSLMASDTMKEAMERLVRFQKIMGDGGNITLEPHDDHYSLVVELTGNKRDVPHQPIDASFAFLLHIIRWILSSDVQPLMVYLKRAVPDSTQPHEEAFGCIPEFASQRDAIVFDKATFEAPLPTADKSLARMHDKVTDEELQSISQDDLVKKVRKLITRKLSAGEVKLEDLLEYFPWGKRTFQRKLKLEGYTFFQLVDETRKTSAHQYVVHTPMSFEEITFLLGFTEHGNFSRAFKRWYGCTPGQYRTSRLLKN
mgnify:FL=1